MFTPRRSPCQPAPSKKPCGQSTGTSAPKHENGQIGGLSERAFLNRVPVDRRSQESGSLAAT